MVGRVAFLPTVPEGAETMACLARTNTSPSSFIFCRTQPKRRVCGKKYAWSLSHVIDGVSMFYAKSPGYGDTKIENWLLNQVGKRHIEGQKSPGRPVDGASTRSSSEWLSQIANQRRRSGDSGYFRHKPESNVSTLSRRCSARRYMRQDRLPLWHRMYERNIVLSVNANRASEHPWSKSWMCRKLR